MKTKILTNPNPHPNLNNAFGLSGIWLGHLVGAFGWGIWLVHLV